MIVDLNPLPYRQAIEMIKWCAEHEIDTEKSSKLVEALSTVNPIDVEWSLDIPDKYITMFQLKWAA